MTGTTRMTMSTAPESQGGDGRRRSGAGRSIASAIGPAVGFPASRPGHLRGEGAFALNAEGVEARPESGQGPAPPDADPASAEWGESSP